MNVLPQRKRTGVNKWLGQPYFLDPWHEDTIEMKATPIAIGTTIRLSFKNSCIRLNYE